MRPALLAVFALVASGCTTWTWGLNTAGQLGDGSTTNRSTPGVIDALPQHGWTQVSAGGNTTCGIRSNGTLWCSGNNGSGQLGDGTNTNRSTLTQEATAATNWATVSTGGQHTCAIKTVGTLWCWGENGNGELGNGTTFVNENAPKQVLPLSDWATVSAGNNHTCATKTNSTLWCWGSNSFGQLGDGTNTLRNSPVQEATSSAVWSTVSLGDDHSCATRINNTMFCWGSNQQTQLGDGTTLNRNTPTQEFSASTDWATVGAGGDHACATRTGGTLWCWGDNSSGQLGDGTVADRSIPTQEATSATTWADPDAGSFAHSCATRTNGTLWCWGSNFSGQLGDGTFTDRLVPDQVGSNTTWSSVTAGGSHTCGIQSSFGERVWCFGNNNNGQLADRTTAPRLIPTPIEPDHIGISAGGSQTCRIRIDRALFCWGNNSNGQLGDGTTTQRTAPTQIGGVFAWATLSAGASHTCGTQTDGTLWCWGRNTNGQLGDGTTTQRTTPKKVGVSNDWASVSAGSSHTCGTRTNGTLWCWGANTQGQFGNGTTTASTVPTQAGTDTDWTVVGTGTLHTCALKSNNTLWCWGTNIFGQLGDGTTTQRLTPTQVGTATTWVGLATGAQHNCALRSTKTIWCWGANSSGQLGDGTTTQRTAPTKVGAFTDWKLVSAGGSHTCGTRGANTLWCWGSNSQGQLGDGTTTQRTTPTPTSVSRNWVFLDLGANHTATIDF